jgi:aspartate racemase
MTKIMFSHEATCSCEGTTPTAVYEIKQGIVGVLGGMGPLATVDFMRKVLVHTNVSTDQDHVPMMVASIPQIPDRSAAIDGSGPSPLDALVRNGRRLVSAGVQLIVMPCNTAHMWYAELRDVLRVPMLHIVDAALEDVLDKQGARARVGLLATPGTLQSRIYPRRAAEFSHTQHLEWVLPEFEELDRWIMPAIRKIKAGRLGEASDLLACAADSLRRGGASCIVLGCTEIPLALNDTQVCAPLIDPADALARLTVGWCRNAERPFKRDNT